MQIIVENFGANISFSDGVLVLECDNKKEGIPLLHISALRLHTNVRISSDAIINCVKSGIPVFFESGLRIDAFVWSANYGSIANIRKKQLLLSYSTLKYKLIGALLKRKNTERLKWLKKLSTKQEISVLESKFYEINRQIEQTQNDETIRSIEAYASKLYFEVFNSILPQHLHFAKREYRNATHLVNKLLNYGYGILYNEITKSLIIAGLDAYCGLFHRNQHNKPALTYDFIEPYRAWVEYIVLKFCKKHQKKLTGDTQLEKELKKNFIADYFEQMSNTIINWDKLRKTPLNIIQINAHKLATYINNLNEHDLIKTVTHK